MEYVQVLKIIRPENILNTIFLARLVKFIYHELSISECNPPLCHGSPTCDLVGPEDKNVLIGGLVAAVILNIVLGLISWWRCYANNYLHWGALATWCLLLVQGLVWMSFSI